MSLSTKSLATRETIISFLEYQNINIETKVSQHTEILENGKQTADYKNIKIALLNNNITKLMFSAHKLYNNLHGITNHNGDAMNHDRFTIDKMKFIHNWLENNFNLDPDMTKIHQLEFGFNLSDLDIDTTTIIDSFISYKGKRFNRFQVLGRGNGIDIRASNYRLKVYDKALQYSLESPILRLEYKALKSIPILNTLNFNPNLTQLVIPQIWRNCQSLLLQVLDNCIIQDEFRINTVKLIKALEWFNPLFWEQCSPSKRSRQKKEFENAVRINGIHQIKATIKEAIQAEFQQML